MIHKDVLLRNQIRTVYSSERQERMKVYFELHKEYQQCIKPCELRPNEMREECMKGCEKIFDQYAKILKPRYQGENKERVYLEVEKSPSFYSKKREDRDSWFYRTVDISFWELLGYNTAPPCDTEPKRVA